MRHSFMVEVENQRQPVLPLFKPEHINGRKPKSEETAPDTVKIINLREEQRVIDGIGEVFGKLYDDL